MLTILHLAYYNYYKIVKSGFKGFLTVQSSASIVIAIVLTSIICSLIIIVISQIGVIDKTVINSFLWVFVSILCACLFYFDNGSRYIKILRTYENNNYANSRFLNFIFFISLFSPFLFLLTFVLFVEPAGIE